MILVSRPEGTYVRTDRNRWIGIIADGESLLYRHANTSNGRWKYIAQWWDMNRHRDNVRILIECPQK